MMIYSNFAGYGSRIKSQKKQKKPQTFLDRYELSLVCTQNRTSFWENTKKNIPLGIYLVESEKIEGQ